MFTLFILAASLALAETPVAPPAVPTQAAAKPTPSMPGPTQHVSALTTQDTLLQRLAPTSCPTGMVLAGKAGTESAFCIDANERPATFYQDAMTKCAVADLYVCTTNEWYIGSQTVGVNGMCNNNWEWTGSKDHAYTSGHLQIVQGAAECTRKSWAWTDQHNNGVSSYTYRCCSGWLAAVFE